MLRPKKPSFIPGGLFMPNDTKRSASGTPAQDAIAMLTADHKKVKRLFSEFDKLQEEGGDEEKASIVRFIPS
jgi:hypothetical protein